jgi:hypothetical protein
MTENEFENQNDENEIKSFTPSGFNKALAILFVLVIYFVIFLKILFID